MSKEAIVRTDGVIEAVLGLVLAIGALAGLLGAGDFPSPVGTVVVAVFGWLLLGVGAVLWWLAGSGRVNRSLLLVLATANACTAVLAVVWLLAAGGFSSAGSALTVATAAALAVLALAQLRAARLRLG
jgi:hypothetical protein